MVERLRPNYTKGSCGFLLKKVCNYGQERKIKEAMKNADKGK